jgi:hypothetical protein
VPYRAWDIDAGVGFLSLTSADSDLGDEGYASDNWNPSWTTSIDVGHFWNSHLKTEGGLSFLQRYETASSQDVLLAGGQHGYIFTRNEIRQVQVTAAATWQFFENTFAHLYVSGGAESACSRSIPAGSRTCRLFQEASIAPRRSSRSNGTRCGLASGRLAR